MVIKVRNLYIFVCKKCKKSNRQSLNEYRANAGLCGVCRRNTIPEGQLSLI